MGARAAQFAFSSAQSKIPGEEWHLSQWLGLPTLG